MKDLLANYILKKLDLVKYPGISFFITAKNYPKSMINMISGDVYNEVFSSMDPNPDKPGFLLVTHINPLRVSPPPKLLLTPHHQSYKYDFEVPTLGFIYKDPATAEQVDIIKCPKRVQQMAWHKSPIIFQSVFKARSLTDRVYVIEARPDGTRSPVEFGNSMGAGHSSFQIIGETYRDSEWFNVTHKEVNGQIEVTVDLKAHSPALYQIMIREESSRMDTSATCIIEVVANQMTSWYGNRQIDLELNGHGNDLGNVFYVKSCGRECGNNLQCMAVGNPMPKIELYHNRQRILESDTNLVTVSYLPNVNNLVYFVGDEEASAYVMKGNMSVWQLPGRRLDTPFLSAPKREHSVQLFLVKLDDSIRSFNTR
jgi:hypothetical protein